MLIKQIIANNPSLQPYEYVNTEIAEDGHRLVLQLASWKASTTGSRSQRELLMDTGMNTISSL